MAIEVARHRSWRGGWTASGGRPRRSSPSPGILAGMASGVSGQASVSFVAVVPLLLLLGMGGLQAAIAGHASVAATHAARAAARAEYAGERPDDAARAALPTLYRERVQVDTSRASGASVRLIAPRVLPFGPRIEVRSSAALGPAGGQDG